MTVMSHCHDHIRSQEKNGHHAWLIVALACSCQRSQADWALGMTDCDMSMFMAGVRRRTGLMQAELQRQFTAIAGIEARMTANNQGINELSLSYSQLTERVEKDSAAQDLLKRLAGWSLFGLYTTLNLSIQGPSLHPEYGLVIQFSLCVNSSRSCRSCCCVFK